jgi:EAL domain-containing protein (putative c-di-GMP-specific phosphodiesterase class I)
MGKGLRHRVIAEGIETLEQLTFLKANGCDEGQGYYFSRPISAQQFASLLEMPCQRLIVNNDMIPFHHDTRVRRP